MQASESFGSDFDLESIEIAATQVIEEEKKNDSSDATFLNPNHKYWSVTRNQGDVTSFMDS